MVMVMEADASAALDRAVEAIAGAGSLALACHVTPDGDALGSMLALFHLARAQGRDVSASFSEPFGVAPHYTFLPGLHLLTKPADMAAEPEVMVTFDCGSIDRLGSLESAATRAGTLVVLDHHVTNDRFGTINVIDADAASTASIVRELAARLGWPLTRDAALCLYTGLVTDTGRFQYSNTTPEVFALAEELSTFDLPIADITRQLFELHRFPYLQMLGMCMARAEIDRELGFVVTWVTNFDLDGFGVEIEETEGLIDVLRRTAEADVACVCKETPDGIKVSLRSTSTIDVGVIAQAFGGGGHKYAAGFTAPYPVTDVVAAVKAELRKQRGTRV
jgi:phosphoesterase RecJ-like protein